jgi:putative chitinase
MAVLHPGDTGDEVSALQKRLIDLGFPPGDLDGKFGPSTEAALRGFQASRGLLVDGVAGPRTLTALGLAADTTLPSVISQVTVDRTCVLFPSSPRANIERHLPVVLQGLVDAALRDKPMVLMALATIRAETEGFEPISEGRSQFNTSPNGRPFDLYDMRTDLGNGQAGDGERYRGRGFIQLTGKANYREHGNAIGLGDALLTAPERANEPVVAAALLASFLRTKERAIKEALLVGNLAQARRLVNGGSHGLDRFTDCYRRGDRLIDDF